MKKCSSLLVLAFLISSCIKQNKHFKLERVIFHTTMCFGTCPIYHLEINSDKNAKLDAEKVFKDDSTLSYEIDTAKTGYFTGVVDDSVYFKLINELETIGLDSLVWEHSDCCDASIITIIVYYNGKRKYFRSMFPPKKANNLIKILYDICETSKLQRVKEGFIIEDEQASR